MMYQPSLTPIPHAPQISKSPSCSGDKYREKRSPIATRFDGTATSDVRTTFLTIPLGSGAYIEPKPGKSPFRSPLSPYSLYPNCGVGTGVYSNGKFGDRSG